MFVYILIRLYYPDRSRQCKLVRRVLFQFRRVCVCVQIANAKLSHYTGSWNVYVTGSQMALRQTKSTGRYVSDGEKKTSSNRPQFPPQRQSFCESPGDEIRIRNARALLCVQYAMPSYRPPAVFVVQGGRRMDSVIIKQRL